MKWDACGLINNEYKAKSYINNDNPKIRRLSKINKSENFAPDLIAHRSKFADCLRRLGGASHKSSFIFVDVCVPTLSWHALIALWPHPTHKLMTNFSIRSDFHQFWIWICQWTRGNSSRIFRFHHFAVVVGSFVIVELEILGFAHTHAAYTRRMMRLFLSQSQQKFKLKSCRLQKWQIGEKK